jgi:hypothetical protein
MASGESSADTRPPDESLSQKDAIVVNQDQREAAERDAKWQAVGSFYRAPCLLESIIAGVAGGLLIGLLRFRTSRDSRSAKTWGACVGGLLYGTNAFVCRRAFHQKNQHEAGMLQRIADESDPVLAEQYREEWHQRTGGKNY